MEGSLFERGLSRVTWVDHLAHVTRVGCGGGTGPAPAREPGTQKTDAPLAGDIVVRHTRAETPVERP
jgi:hypothetical protein